MPDVHGLTAQQLALQQGSDVMLPDILLVEFMINDFMALRRGASLDFSHTKPNSSSADLDVSDGSENMRRFLRSAVAHPATAPVLVNTLYDNGSKLETTEKLFAAPAAELGIPIISWSQRFDSLHNGTEQRALALLVRDAFFHDDRHLSDAGHVDLALHIVLALQSIVQRISNRRPVSPPGWRLSRDGRRARCRSCRHPVRVAAAGRRCRDALRNRLFHGQVTGQRLSASQ